METRFRPELSKEERAKILKAQSFGIETSTHYRQLSAEELDAVNGLYHENFAKIQKLSDEAKAKAKEYKEQIEELSGENIGLHRSYLTKSAEMTENLYLIDDQDRGMMEYYNAEGDLIKSRRLKPDEKGENNLRIAANQ